MTHPSSQSPNPRYRLTPRQKQVIRLLLQEKTDVEIAEAMGIAKDTVASQLSKAAQRLGLSDSPSEGKTKARTPDAPDRIKKYFRQNPDMVLPNVKTAKE